jgi:hypothetical protein
VRRREGGVVNAQRIAVAESTDLRESLFAFRYQVYGQELEARLPAAVVEAGRFQDELDEHGTNYAALEGTAVVGSLRVVAAPHLSPAIRSRYSIDEALKTFRLDEIVLAGRLAVAPHRRHGGLMLRMMATAYAEWRSRGVRLVFSDCSPHLLSLYESLGYVQHGEPFVDPVFGPKRPIVWALGDLERMTAIASPMLPCARPFSADPSAARWVGEQRRPRSGSSFL